MCGWMDFDLILNVFFQFIEQLIKFNLMLFLHIVFICLQILGSPEAEDLGHKNADIHCWILVIYLSNFYTVLLTYMTEWFTNKMDTANNRHLCPQKLTFLQNWPLPIGTHLEISQPGWCVE